jgi:hypothetical protein
LTGSASLSWPSVTCSSHQRERLNHFFHERLCIQSIVFLKVSALKMKLVEFPFIKTF